MGLETPNTLSTLNRREKLISLPLKVQGLYAAPRYQGSGLLSLVLPFLSARLPSRDPAQLSSSRHIRVPVGTEEEGEKGMLLPFKDTSQVHDTWVQIFCLSLVSWP